MEINWKKISIWKALTYLVYVIVVFFAIAVLMSKFSLWGIQLFTVQSGSMEPTIKTGSLLIDKGQKEYEVNNIVTFKNKDNPRETTTHRIVDEKLKGDNKKFITQGDANNNPDSDELAENLIIGKVVFKIPYIGYAVAFSRTLPGLIFLIIIPATIIIYDEINNIKKEIILRGKRGRKKVINGN